VGKRRHGAPAGFHQHYRPRTLARGYCRFRIDLRVWAAKKNVGDSLNVVIQIERRPGRRFISEVLEIKSYDPDADLFDFCAIYSAPRERP
jgi:hypothetical protein